MVARGGHGTHPGHPQTVLEGSRNYGLRLVATRCAARRHKAVVGDHDIDLRPVLVVHGTEDRILPFDSTAARLPALIADCTLVPVEGGPHNIGWTHPDEVNSALLEFIAAEVPVTA